MLAEEGANRSLFLVRIRSVHLLKPVSTRRDRPDHFLQCTIAHLFLKLPASRFSACKLQIDEKLQFNSDGSHFWLTAASSLRVYQGKQVGDGLLEFSRVNDGQ